MALDYEVEMSKPETLSTEYELPDCKYLKLNLVNKTGIYFVLVNTSRTFLQINCDLNHNF